MLKLWIVAGLLVLSGVNALGQNNAPSNATPTPTASPSPTAAPPADGKSADAPAKSGGDDATPDSPLGPREEKHG